MLMVALGGVLLLAGIYYKLCGKVPTEATLPDLARFTAGLKLELAYNPQRTVASASYRGMRLFFSPLAKRENITVIRLEIESDTGPFDLRLIRRDQGFPLAPSLPTGDAAFDEMFVLSAPAESVRLRFNKETRLALMFAFHNVVFTERRLCFEGLFQEDPLGDSFVVTALKVAARFCLEPAELLDAFMNHEDHGERLIGLQALRPFEEGDPLVAPTARAALNDSYERVRVAAAVLLGEEGAPYLLEMLPHLSLPEAQHDALAAAAALGPSAVSAIVAACKNLLPDEEVRAIAVLAQLDAPEAEPYLMARVKEGLAPIQSAALTALEKLGTAQSLPALVALREGGFNPHLLSRLRTTIGTIQARLGPLGPGMLSPVEPGCEGGLSPVASEGGLSPIDRV